jgi:hypothetical protein
MDAFLARYPDARDVEPPTGAGIALCQIPSTTISS